MANIFLFETYFSKRLVIFTTPIKTKTFQFFHLFLQLMISNFYISTKHLTELNIQYHQLQVNIGQNLLLYLAK